MAWLTKKLTKLTTSPVTSAVTAKAVALAVRTRIRFGVARSVGPIKPLEYSLVITRTPSTM